MTCSEDRAHLFPNVTGLLQHIPLIYLVKTQKFFFVPKLKANPYVFILQHRKGKCRCLEKKKKEIKVTLKKKKIVLQSNFHNTLAKTHICKMSSPWEKTLGLTRNLTWGGDWFALHWMINAHSSESCLSFYTSLEHWQFALHRRENPKCQPRSQLCQRLPG